MSRESRPARRVLSLLRQQPWLLDAHTLERLAAIAERAHAPDFEAVLAKRGQRLERSTAVEMRGDVAVLSIDGPIFRYANLFTDISGAVSIEMLAEDLRTALRSPKVGAIILNIDSAGGQVNGTSEFAQMVFDARRVKPVVAYAGGTAASAAYWIASAASRIVANDTAALGSIGVVASYVTDEDDGITEIVSSQSPRKRIDVREDDGRAQAQAHVDALAEVFVQTVARNRGVTREFVLNAYGAGAVLIGAQAVAMGMADEIGSLEGLIAQLGGKAQGSAKAGNTPLSLVEARARASKQLGNQYAADPVRRNRAIDDLAVQLIHGNTARVEVS